MGAVGDVEAAVLAAGTAVRYPAAPYASALGCFETYAVEAARAARTVEPGTLDRAAAVLLEAYARDAGVFSCGNGGSAVIASHIQCDHVKGVRTATDLVSRVVSLSADVELLTAVANEVGYEDVFLYQSQSRPGDVLVAVSSSGRSPNIVRALVWARDHGLRTIAVIGFDGAARAVVDVSVHVDGANCGVVEGLAPGDQARPSPVHPPVADEPGRDLLGRVLSHDNRPMPSSVICEYLSCQSTQLRATVSPSTL